MKDWQFFILLGAIYGAPHLPRRYALVCSAVGTFVALGFYYFGGA